MRCHHYHTAFSRQIVYQDFFEFSLPAPSCQWLSVQIPFKRNHGGLEFCPEILANGMEVDEAKWWRAPIPAVFNKSRSVHHFDLGAS